MFDALRGISKDLLRCRQFYKLLVFLQYGFAASLQKFRLLAFFYL